MTIFHIKMKIRTGGGALGQEGGTLGQQGAPPPLLFLFMANTRHKDIQHGKGKVSNLLILS